MGLAASQGRLLSLTARNHDLVYEGQQISQQRLVLAEQSREIADRYNQAMNNTIMQVTINGETQPLTFDALTNQDPMYGLCMRLVDLNGNVVVPGESIEVQQEHTDEETNVTTKSIVGRFTNSADFINAYMKELSDDQKSNLLNASLATVFSYYSQQYDKKDESLTIVHRNKSSEDYVKDGEKVLNDPNVYDAKYLQEMISKGQFLIQQVQANGKFEDIVWQGSTMISEVFDTSDDAAAESEYEASMVELQRRDKILELRLDQVETQQEAVHTELESVRKIVDQNIEESFKTFA